MILADTTLWIDLWRGRDDFITREMQNLLIQGQIVMHPVVIAELALGSLHNRQQTLAELDGMDQLRVARLDEVRVMIETHALYSRGIGLTDAHLIASCLISPPARLWTRDIRLKSVAEALGIHFNLP